jgi:multidrug efflux pump subunit AcrA (membrane-fusion protein)
LSYESIHLRVHCQPGVLFGHGGQLDGWPAKRKSAGTGVRHTAGACKPGMLDLLRKSQDLAEQAQAELRDATSSLNRNKELFSRGVVPRQTYDDVLARYEKAVAGVAAGEAALKAATAALEGASALLEYTPIRAPFDAVVLTKDADIGDIVTPLGAAANAKAAELPSPI